MNTDTEPAAGIARAGAVSIALALLIAAAAGRAIAAPVEDGSSNWRVAGGEIVIELNQGVLSPLGIEATAVRAMNDDRPEHPLGHRRLRFEGLSIQDIRFSAPGGAVEDFFGGHLHYHGGLQLKIGETVLDITDFRVAPHPEHQGLFQLLDRQGTAWATLDHGHVELVDGGSALEIRHANLSMSKRLAERIGQPELAGQVFAAVHLRAPVVSAAPAEQVQGTECSVESANWPTEQGFDADVALIGMKSTSSARSVQSPNCSECDGSSGGAVVITPNARLRNVGTADVPWWEQFTSPQPPYENDQHPYLVWNLYRLDADGRWEQVGASGAKHAFFTVNDACDCAGGNILWAGCEDIYSVSSNDDGKYLAPRDEVVPADGLWGRCNSLFDPDCQGSQTNQSNDTFENRMLALEQDLDPGNNPDARYFIEAWYVIRDDIDIFNTMGWQEIAPEWNGTNWLFNDVDEFHQGPALDAWVDSSAPGPGRDSALLETGDGRIRVAMRATDLEDGSWRYDYVVANHDFARAETTGNEPDLAVVDSAGLTAVEIPRVETITISSTGFARADRTTGSDWEVSIQSDGVRWQDPSGTPLNWGRAFRFSLVADRPPGPVTVRLYPASGAPERLTVSTLGPELPELLFDDSFESPTSP